MPRFVLSLAVLALVSISGGCSSIKGTLLQRDQGNFGWQKIEGEGIPITLEVPTHLQITIVDVKYAHRDANLKWVLLTNGKAAVITTDVKHNFIKTKKIFMIDPKRPAAGDVSFKIDLAEDQQYLDKIESELTDRTIQETSQAFERLIVALRPRGAGGGRSIGGDANPLAELESVRAVEIFEVDDPTFEQNISAFLAEHLCAAPICETTVIDDMSVNNLEMLEPGANSPIANHGDIVDGSVN